MINRLSNFLKLVSACLASLVSTCTPAKGPVLVNASGAVAHVSSSYEDGRAIESDLENGHVLWLGSGAAPLSAVVVRVGVSTFTLSAAGLRTPLEGDKWAAFILKKGGLQKVKFDVAMSAAGRR
jgi:hypothetical protein